ncbi:MAG TPA: hypothetical protein VI759_05645 [Dehalococcoidia bacterium]|nr:hypothetical protein [Dehalococcoidia bacterium]
MLRPVYWPLHRFWQDLPYRLRFVRALARRPFHAETILFYPDRPGFGHIAARVCWLLGYRTTNHPSARAVAAFAFEDATYKRPDAALDRPARDRFVINARCRDVSKSAVEAAHVRAFGYGLAVDPRGHAGRCVRKSELNSMHDGRLIDCPAEPEPGYVYQRYIEAADAGGRHVDIRVPVIGDTIPFVYLWLYDPNDVFDVVAAASVEETDAYLTAEEQRQIVAFCRELGLDFGELDVLRDNADNRIYVIDATDTPSGPIDVLPRRERLAAVARIAAAFKTRFVDTHLA